LKFLDLELWKGWLEMKTLINILVLFLVSCGSAILPDGTKIQGIGQDVAYEKTPDGTVRYVSTTSASFLGATNAVQSVANSAITASVTKVGIKALQETQNIIATGDATAKVKGTVDPNVIPKNPNIIPEDPNIP